MNNERSDWHSDDDLASALERALDVPQGEASGVSPSVTPDSGSSINDLFASLVAEDASATSRAPDSLNSPPVAPDPTPAAPVMDAPPIASEPAAVFPANTDPNTHEADEQVFESLDDFKPRTNFVPIQAPIDESVVAVTEEAAEMVVVHPVSSQVTMPVQWTPHRRSFDEIVFGSSNLN